MTPEELDQIPTSLLKSNLSNSAMAELREIVTGLQFPRGADRDGTTASVVLVEIKRGTLSRVDVEKGTIDVIAEVAAGGAQRRGDRTPTARCTSATTAAASSSSK